MRTRSGCQRWRAFAGARREKAGVYPQPNKSPTSNSKTPILHQAPFRFPRAHLHLLLVRSLPVPHINPCDILPKPSRSVVLHTCIHPQASSKTIHHVGMTRQRRASANGAHEESSEQVPHRENREQLRCIVPATIRRWRQRRRRSRHDGEVTDVLIGENLEAGVRGRLGCHVAYRRRPGHHA